MLNLLIKPQSRLIAFKGRSKFRTILSMLSSMLYTVKLAADACWLYSSNFVLLAFEVLTLKYTCYIYYYLVVRQVR